MALKKVFIANPSVPRVAYNIFENFVEVITSSGYDRESIIKGLSGANVDALFWAGGVKLDKEILDTAGPQVKVVGTMSAGYNHIDTALLKAKGIVLGNTPRVLDDAVADVALLLAMSASRRYTEGRRHIEEGTWINFFNTQWMLGQDISGSTVGIVGLGNIGQAIAKRLKGFGVAKILYTGHREKPEGKELGAQFVNQDTLNRESDFIFLAAPLTNETNQMCNADFFFENERFFILYHGYATVSNLFFYRLQRQYHSSVQKCAFSTPRTARVLTWANSFAIRLAKTKIRKSADTKKNERIN